MTIHNEIDNGRAFDWGRTSDDCAKYRDIYPPEFYAKILQKGLCEKGGMCSTSAPEQACCRGPFTGMAPVLPAQTYLKIKFYRRAKCGRK